MKKNNKRMSVKAGLYDISTKTFKIDNLLNVCIIEKTYKDGRKATGYLIDQIDNKDIVITREFGRDSIFLKVKGFLK